MIIPVKIGYVFNGLVTYTVGSNYTLNIMKTILYNFKSSILFKHRQAVNYLYREKGAKKTF